MAAVQSVETSPLLTYEQYMAEGEVFQRYDIIDGVRIVTNPTRYHQRALFRIARLFSDFETASGLGQALIAPCDVLIRRSPLRTRQPDVLFISNERLGLNPPETDAAPLVVAPELVVEILSPSESRRSREDKIRDYCAAGVLECWLVSPAARSVEVLRLASDGTESMALYGRGEVAQSVVFPGLRVPVEAIVGG